MRMSELSSRSGVAVPSIKFYLREGILPAGERTSPNQSSYDERHVARLKIIRALIEVGGLSISSAKGVLAAVDDTEMPIDWAFGQAQRAIPGSLVLDEESEESPAALNEELAARSWAISAGNPGRAMVARVLGSYERLGHPELAAVLPAYLDAAETVARADLAAVAASEDRARMIETVVVGTVLGDSLFAGLRRIAQERESRSLFPAPPHIDADCDDDALEAPHE